MGRKALLFDLMRKIAQLCKQDISLSCSVKRGESSVDRGSGLEGEAQKSGYIRQARVAGVEFSIAWSGEAIMAVVQCGNGVSCKFKNGMIQQQLNNS